MRVSRLPFWMVLWATCWAATSALGQRPRSVALHFTRAAGAETCIAPRELARRVEELTGPRLAAPADADVTLEVTASPDRELFRVRIVRLGADGKAGAERVLSSRKRDCRELDGVLAFVLALAVNPELSISDLPPSLLAEFAQESAPGELLLRELDAEPPTVRPSPVHVPSVIPAPTPVAAPFTARESTRASLALWGLLAGGTFDVPLLGVEGALTVDPPRVFPLMLSARFSAGTHDVPLAVGTFADPRAGEVAFQFCPLGLAFARLRIRGCVGGALGALSGEGSGFSQNHRVRLWDAAAVASLGLRLALGRSVGLDLTVSGRVRLLTSRFDARDDAGVRTRALEPGQLGYALALGPFFDF